MTTQGHLITGRAAGDALRTGEMVISARDNMADTNDSPWFFVFGNRPRPSMRLYCFPYAGGQAAIFRNWGKFLSPDIELIGIELPGRGRRRHEEPQSDLPNLVEHIAEAIAKQDECPFAFFGHSMGAVMAYEVTHSLRRKSARQPVHLFVSGRRAVHLPHHEDPVSQLTDAEFLDKLRRLNGTPPEMLQDPGIMELVMPVLKADFTALDKWRYASADPLSMPLTAITGLSDPTVGIEAAKEWRNHSLGAFHFYGFPGDHFFLRSNEARLVTMISQSLSLDSWS